MQSIASGCVCVITLFIGQEQKYPDPSQNKSYITLQFGSCLHAALAFARVSYILVQNGQNFPASFFQSPIVSALI